MKRIYSLLIALILFSSATFATGHVVTGTIVNNAVCGGSNAKAYVTVTGGVGPYTYNWSPSGQTADTLFNASPGSYTCTVTDQSDMSIANTVITITNNPGPTALTVTPTNSSCGAANGMFVIGAVTSGTSPYIYSVNGSAYTSNTTYTGLTAGTYTVIVKDANGCSFTSNTTINNNSGPTSVAITPSNSSCGNANGMFTIGAVTGGTFPYTYSVNGGAYASTTTYTGLFAGTYTITVKDANGCTFTSTTVVGNTSGPTDVVLSTSNAACGQSNGIIDVVSVTGGTPMYQYSLQGAPYTTQTTYTGLAQGSYTITVRDANNCMYAEVVTVGSTSAPVATIITNSNASCAGSCDGTMTGMATGGTPPYTYQWMTGNTTQTANNLCAGVYTLTVTDQNGCIANATGVVTQPPTLVANATSTNPSGCGACDGTAQGSVSGGTSPYTYLWSNATTAPNNTGLCPGVHTLSITDANGCSATAFAAVSSGGTLNVSTTAIPDTCGQSHGSATANVSGSQGPLTFLWQPGNYTTQSIANIPAGNYFLTVTDSVCSYSTSVSVTNYGAPNVTATSNAASCGNPNGLMVVNASNGTAPYQFSINGGALSINTTYNNLAAGVYTIVCIDNNGCQSTYTHNIQTTGFAVYFSTSNATCNLSNGSSFAGATGGSSPYTYLWSTGSSNQTITNLATGTYTCTVTDNAGCIATGITTVNSQATIYMGYDYDYYNCGVNSLTATASFGTAPYTYTWTPSGGNTATASNLPAGNYTCTATDANGCMSTGSYWIYNNSWSQVTGHVYADLNGNCTYDSGEQNTVPVNISVINNLGQTVGWGQIYSGGWCGTGATVNNTYSIYLPFTAGTYTVQVINPSYYNNPNITFTCTNNVITLSGNCNTLINLDLGYQPVVGQDIRVTDYCGVARPGFSRYNQINYYNPGTVTVPATIKMHLDNMLTYSGATPPPTNITGNTLEWNIGSLAHGQSGTIWVNSTVPTIQNGGALGTVLRDSVWIEPIIGDNYVSDNLSACSSIIVGSYDPNMKEVYSENMDVTGGIDTTDTDLYYTVHFQNTGTDTAFTITVKDTISDLLEMNTLEVLSASHPYSVTIQPNKVLQVRFDNILLVDSNRNEVLSHGYFHYKIRTKSNLSYGQQIENTADIYFDFNDPVITNTVVTPVQAPVGIKNNKTQLNALVYPNPANGGSFKIQLNDASYKQLHFSLYNVAGMKVADKMLLSQPVNEVSTVGLTNGIYFYQLINADGKKVSGKIVINN